MGCGVCLSRKTCIPVMLGLAVASSLFLLTYWKRIRYMELKHSREVGIVQVQDPLSPVPKRYNGTGMPGDPFNVSDTLLARIGLPPPRFITLRPDTMKDFVFAHGSSEDHFEESQDLVGSIHKHFPGYTFLYYDLGLKEDQIKKVKSWCNVKYRVFDANKYPDHVGNLSTHSFKAMIIQEIMQEYGALFWVDASIRLVTNDLSQAFRIATNTQGLCAFSPTGHSIFAVTHQDMVKFLVMDKAAQIRTTEFESGSLLLYNTEALYWRVLHWWYLCNLDQRCIAPKGDYTYKCHFRNTRTIYANCHRYDQSAIDILVANYYGNSFGKYMSMPRSKTIHISRHKSLGKALMTCA